MRRSKYSSVSDINVTSLVDVTMVLLIIFMLTAPFIQAGIELKLPKAKSKVIKESDAITISVSKEGDVYIEKEKVPDGKLADALATLKTLNPKGVFIRADKDVSYGTVMVVIGEVKAAGIDDVGMLTQLKDQ
jgi:biopolymer transport protein TolR